MGSKKDDFLLFETVFDVNTRETIDEKRKTVAKCKKDASGGIEGEGNKVELDQRRNGAEKARNAEQGGCLFFVDFVCVENVEVSNRDRETGESSHRSSQG